MYRVIIPTVAVLILFGLAYVSIIQGEHREVVEYGDTSNESSIIKAEMQEGDNISEVNNEYMRATIETTKGDIEIEFFPNDAPKTVNNFTTLASQGFYDGVIFHRVIEGFMIQGGDPTGTGTGGPGYTFEDELDPQSQAAQRGYIRGTVAMANSGPDTNGSQFFIVHQDAPLPLAYTIFGKVVSGMEVVDEIAQVETDSRDKPLEEVVMERVVVEE